jgi:hypothetical protein
MRSLKEFLVETKAGGDSTHYVELNINNVEVLYQKAMRSKNPEDLKAKMVSMKSKFTDIDKINFSNVEWDKIYDELNESMILEGAVADALDDINTLIDKARRTKDKKTLDLISKELDKILKQHFD